MKLVKNFIARNANGSKKMMARKMTELGITFGHYSLCGVLIGKRGVMVRNIY